MLEDLAIPLRYLVRNLLYRKTTTQVERRHFIFMIDRPQEKPTHGGLRRGRDRHSRDRDDLFLLAEIHKMPLINYREAGL